MKSQFKLFSTEPIKLNLHLNADMEAFDSALNAHIDTLLGLHERGHENGFITHEKDYRGVIRDEYFEAKRKFVVGVFTTYNPWVIRGDFDAVGSNVELELSTNRTETLRENLITFFALPLIVLVIILFKEDQRPGDYLMLSIAIIIPVGYHFISRWLQILALNRFVEIITQNIRFSKIPQ